jgi:hypothetical protein
MRVLIALTTFVLVPVASLMADAGPTPGVRQYRRAESETRHSQTTARFNLDQSRENPNEFNLILTDGEEAVVSGLFFLDQLYDFRDLMLEARKFAYTEESVGKDEPVITRIANQENPSFAIDVSKRGNQSQFFITVKSQGGRLTVDAGAIVRSEKREEGFFFDVLKRLQYQIAKSTGQPIK